MEYYELTTEKAIQFLRDYPGEVVLLAVKNLEDDDNAAFVKVVKDDCESMLREAETIASVYDDFARQLRVFSHKQNILDVLPLGLQRTILFGNLKGWN